jgi:Ca2+-binding EF-hand superfamily protein
MPKKLLQNFDVIDTNKDGMITESELFAAFDNGVIKR